VRASQEGRDELSERVQRALSLPTKKEAEHVVSTVIASLETTLRNNLGTDGFTLKLNSFGKFSVRHRPGIVRKLDFSGETIRTKMLRKIKFVSRGASPTGARWLMRRCLANVFACLDGLHNPLDMKHVRTTVLEVVGASGFEPPTSWSQTVVSKILSRFGGVAYKDQNHFSSSLLIEPNLNLSVGVNPSWRNPIERSRSRLELRTQTLQFRDESYVHWPLIL